MIDRNRALTSEDLIRRYDLESLKSNRKAIQNNKNGLDKTENILNNFILSVLKGVSNTENQVDGKITTWFYNYEPTLNIVPASNWTTDALKNSHLGDLFYNKNTGYVYMFDIVNEVYQWVRQTDESTIQAMAIANSNPDTSDGYRNIFVIEPTAPYKVGDIWFKEDGSIYRCNVARASGDFNDAEWIPSNEYSNDNYINNAAAIIDDFKETITANYICKVLVKTTRDTIELSVQGITGGYSGTLATLNAALQIEAGKISQIISAVGDNGEVTAGSIILAINGDTSQAIIDANKISLAGKTIDLTSDTIEINSANFSVDDTGYMVAKSGKVAGFGMTDEKFEVNVDGIYDYNYLDLNNLYLIGSAFNFISTPTNIPLFNCYDANNDNIIDLNDYIKVKNILYNGATNDKEVTGVFQINTKNPKKCITISKNGENAVSLGLGGIETNMLNSDYIFCGTVNYVGAFPVFSGFIIDGALGAISMLDNGIRKGRIFNDGTLNMQSISAPSSNITSLTAGNIDSGACTLNSSTNVSVSFNKTFANVPRVVLTPNTTTSGVIAPKIREVSTTGFKAIIGGSISGSIDCDWIAISQ